MGVKPLLKGEVLGFSMGVRVCSQLYYPTTCGPKGDVSSSAAAEPTAVVFYMIFPPFPIPARQSSAKLRGALPS